MNIVRDPYVLYASTMNLWRVFFGAHGLQPPRCEGLEEYVLNTFLLMHRKLEEARPHVDSRRFYDIRYEDLVADPVGEVRALYEHFGWDYEDVRPGVEEYVASVSGYRPNRYGLTAEKRATVARCWRPYFERYGYNWQSEEAALLVRQEDRS